MSSRHRTWSVEERDVLRTLRRPEGVQRFVDERPYNKEDGGAWGAVGKSKSVGLRFRDPVYRTPLELAMSYFETYCNDDAEKTLRAISRPIDLWRLDGRDWERSEQEIWDLSEWIGLHAVRPLVTPAQARSLRRVEPVAFAQGLLPGQKHPPRESIQG